MCPYRLLSRTARDIGHPWISAHLCRILLCTLIEPLAPTCRSRIQPPWQLAPICSHFFSMTMLSSTMTACVTSASTSKKKTNTNKCMMKFLLHAGSVDSRLPPCLSHAIMLQVLYKNFSRWMPHAHVVRKRKTSPNVQYVLIAPIIHSKTATVLYLWWNAYWCSNS